MGGKNRNVDRRDSGTYARVYDFLLRPETAYLSPTTDVQGFANCIRLHQEVSRVAGPSTSYSSFRTYKERTVQRLHGVHNNFEAVKEVFSSKAEPNMYRRLKDHKKSDIQRPFKACIEAVLNMREKLPSR